MRGIGVAVITSTSGASPLARQRQPLVHAEAVLLVDHDEAEPAEGHAGLEQRMRADGDLRLPAAIRSSASARSGARSLPVSSTTLDAGRLRERRDGGKMLARQQLRRRHQRGLPAGLGDVRHGDQRDDRLAGADIALQQPQHAVLAGEIARDLRRAPAAATASG